MFSLIMKNNLGINFNGSKVTFITKALDRLAGLISKFSPHDLPNEFRPNGHTVIAVYRK